MVSDGKMKSVLAHFSFRLKSFGHADLFSSLFLTTIGQNILNLSRIRIVRSECKSATKARFDLFATNLYSFDIFDP